MKLHKLSIVLVRQASLRCNVHDENAFLSFKDVSQLGDLRTIDVCRGDIEEGGEVRTELVLALLRYELKAHVTHD